MRTERGFTRLVSFSDGVVAIAITLLVLPLVTAAAEESGNIVTFLATNSWQFFDFALSFLVIGRFWMVHHQIYENLTGYTPALVWANMLWLISIVFLPFPTQLLGSDRQSPLIYALYIGTMVITSLASTLQMWIAVRSPSIQAAEIRGTLKATPSLSILLLFLVALILAVSVPAIGLWALLLTALSGPLDKLIQSRGTRTSPSSTPKESDAP